MAQKTPLGALMPTKEGNYIRLWSDGSMTTLGPNFEIINDDPSPNPARAAAVASGNPQAAEAIKATSFEDARRFNEGQQRLKETHALAVSNARTADDVARANIIYQQGQMQLARDRLGLDALVAASNLRGEENYFAERDMVHGFAGRQDIPSFLQGRQPDFQQRGGDPVPVSMNSLANRMGMSGGVGAAAGGVGSERDRQDASAASAIRQKALNPHSGFAPGEWERWSDGERKLFLSGVEEAGMNKSGFLDTLRKSRIGQGYGSSRAA